MADEGSKEAGGTVVEEPERKERDPEPERVGDQQDPALERAARGRGKGQDAAEDDPDTRRPADGEDRTEPERRPEPAATHEASTQPVDRPRAVLTAAGVRAAEGDRARRAGEGRRGTRVERSPGTLQDRDPDEA